MRVWIIEDQPDYEPGTRRGVYTSPHAAWGDLFEILDDHILQLPSFTLEAVQPDGPSEDDASIDLVHYSNDRLRLVGVYVKGTGDAALTAQEKIQLQEVAALISQQARNIDDFERTEVVQWDVRRTEKPTAVWRFVKQGD